jgi:hypothetical protein
MIVGSQTPIVCKVHTIAKNEKSIVLLELVQNNILNIRGFKVILDADLAILYDVPTKRLNEQVKRNHERFPPDFMFQLTPDEEELLRSQIATTNKGRGNLKHFSPCSSCRRSIYCLLRCDVLHDFRAG